jgi:hypothetical protein
MTYSRPNSSPATLSKNRSPGAAIGHLCDLSRRLSGTV